MPSFALPFLCLACASRISRARASSGSIRQEDGTANPDQLMRFAAFLLSASPSPATAFKPPAGSPLSNLPRGLPSRSEAHSTGSGERRHLDMVVADDVVVEDEESIGSGKPKSILKLQVKTKSSARKSEQKSQAEADAEAEALEQERLRNKQEAEEAMQRALRAMKEEREKQRKLKAERLKKKAEEAAKQREKEAQEKMAKRKEKEQQAMLESLKKIQTDEKPAADRSTILQDLKRQEKQLQVGVDVDEDLRRKRQDDDDEQKRPEYYIMSPLECENMIDQLLAERGPGSGNTDKRFRLDINTTQACIHGLKKEVALERKREQLDQERKKAKARKLTDAQFAKEVGLKGGKKGLNRELLRLKLTKRIFLKGCRGLNVWTANHYKNKGVSMEDLLMAGDRGLLEAGLIHDPNLGFQFSTLAVLIMKRHMITELSDGAGTIRLPRGVQTDFYKSMRIKRELEGDGTTADWSEVADVMEKTDTRLEKVNAHLADTRTLSLDAQVYKNSDGGNAPTRDQVTEQREQRRIDECCAAELMQKDVDKLMTDLLTPRERLVLSQRFGLTEDSAGMDEGISLVETARDLGLSVERVRQIERVALMKMNPIWN